MNKLFALLLLGLLTVSCEQESDVNAYQQDSSKSQKQVKSNNTPLNKTERILKFENAFQSFNQNAKNLGEEKAEQLIREEAISYLTNRGVDYDANRLTAELVVAALDEISKELNELNP